MRAPSSQIVGYRSELIRQEGTISYLDVAHTNLNFLLYLLGILVVYGENMELACSGLVA